MYSNPAINHRIAPNWQTTCLAFFCTALAAGVVANDVSYVILPAIFLLSFLVQKNPFSKDRKFLILLTFSLVIFGSVKGYFVGNDLQHVARFTAPLTVFLVFCFFPGISLYLFFKNNFIISISFILTAVFFYIIKSGDFIYADRFMQAWTITYSSNAAVSTWHYFSMPFFVVGIYSIFFNDNKDLKSTITFLVSFLSIAMLYLLTDTSAFYISVVFVVIVVLFHFISRMFFNSFSLLIVSLLLLDFLIFKITSRIILDIIDFFGYDDAGNMLRIIQLEYFVDNASFFGSGFGARHDFPFEIDQTRQLSQIIYPYASELPIVNIIFNGGIFAALWFLVLFICVMRISRFKPFNLEQRKIRAFALGCSAVLIGSISNPFLFSPVSMLLLAVIFDVFDLIRSGNMPIKTSPV